MGARRFLIILSVMAFAVLAVFPDGTWAAGKCLAPANQGMTVAECVNLDGYDVRIVRSTTPPEGLFPFRENGDSVFKWAITGAGATKNANTIDMKIPVNIGSRNDLNASIEVSVQNCRNLSKIALWRPTGWFLFDKGLGGIIGFTEMDYYVLRVIPPTACKVTPTAVDAGLEVRFKSKLLASGLNTFFVRSGVIGQAMNLPGPSLSSPSNTLDNQPPLRSVESFKLGDRNCSMVITLNSDGTIANAFTRGEGEGCPADLTVESLSKAFVCDDGGNGNPVNCHPKRFVEQNIIDKSGDDSTYCYYTTTGQRVCKKF